MFKNARDLVVLIQLCGRGYYGTAPGEWRIAVAVGLLIFKRVNDFTASGEEEDRAEYRR